MRLGFSAGGRVVNVPDPKKRFAHGGISLIRLELG
jgi:hypothetical protein